MAKPTNKDNSSQRPTVAARNARIKQVYQLLMGDYNRSQILEYCKETWDLEMAASDNLISAATSLINEDLAVSRISVLGVTIQKQKDLYNRALQENNLAVARQVIMDSAKLFGLDQNTTTHIIEDKRDPEVKKLSDEELDFILSQNSDD